MYHDVKKVLKTVHYKAYDVRHEVIDGEEHGCADVTLKSAYSKSGEYIGSARDAFRLANRHGIVHFEKRTPKSSGCSIGWSPKDGKWYGWSHRAVYGFKPGSKCEMGTCQYKAANKQDFRDYMVAFWSSDSNTNVKVKYATDNGEKGIEISWVASNSVKNKMGRGTTTEVFQAYPKKWGKGEWEAETYADAKQMAKDFAEGVS